MLVIDDDKVAVFSDLHAHPWLEFATLDEHGRNSRLMDCITVLTEIAAYCQGHGIGYVLFGGDLMHKRGWLNTETFNLTAAAMRSFRDLGIKVVAVDGNHDHADRAGRNHALQALQAMELLVAPGKHGSSTVECGAGVVSMFSYNDHPDVLKRRLEAEDMVSRTDHRGVPRLALFHHGFKGARVGSSLEYVVKEHVDPDLLKGHHFDFIFSGHYHTRQRIGDMANALYIGATHEHSRSSRNTVNKRGFLVYSFKNKKPLLVPLKRPRFVTILESEWMLYHEPWEGNFVDIVMDRGGDPDFYKSELLACGARGVKIVAPPAKAVEHETRLNVDPSLDPNEVVDRYVDYQQEDIKEHHLDAAELKRLGRELLTRAQEE